MVVDELAIDIAKTKAMALLLAGLVGEGQTALVCWRRATKTVEQSLRNLPQAKLLRAGYLNIRDLLGCDKVIAATGGAGRSSRVTWAERLDRQDE